MPALQSAIDSALIAAQSAADKLATDIVIIDVSEQLVITDCFVLCSGANELQVRGIVNAIEEGLHVAGAKRLRKEGTGEATWVLIDYGDIVVHVQLAEERIHYALERLWKDCPLIELPSSINTER
ncbi:MAG: ribosome silencing factor [Actinomycetales bacterium]|jgi:ribosome-associated protein|nr:ribosome silencing factor [Candidatus Nanopelagicales bacterium]NQW32792.1 ribosome silencing factor [Actinomycetales bacterium]|tara:strand:- start:112 stop:486 length:375 start_codon:yes stop_codon:yes gene_type:complete